MSAVPVGADTLRFELQREGTGTVLTLVDVIDELGNAARDAAGGMFASTRRRPASMEPTPHRRGRP